ncbi:MAG: pyridoxal-phosphate dependent enzyme [Nannocystis sp.]|nr:pyridoxal-phosphate dependent enzyme [Nannocystis sp.]
MSEAGARRLREDHGLGSRLSRPPPCLALATLPTPLERARWLDDGAEVWVKRDDQSSALYGGGKVRKLEWLLASERFGGSGPIVSVGGIASNHLVALALFLQRTGRPLHALTFEQPLTPHGRMNLAALMSLGARFWHVRRRAALPWAWLGYQLWAKPVVRGEFMAPGASDGRGGLGFVEAGLELARQIAEGAAPRPGQIYITGGSAGAAAGLALGLAIAGVSTELRIVAAVERWGFNGLLLRRMLGQIFAELVAHGLGDSLGRGGVAGLLAGAGVTWSIDHTQVGPGYGAPTAAGAEAVRLAAQHGLHLETTYTGKCLAALRGDLRGGRAQGPVIFWNTHAGADLRRWVKPGWEAALPQRLARRVEALSLG